MGLFSPKFSEWKTIPLVSSQQNHFKHVLEFDWLPATKNPIRLENNAKYLKNLYSGGPVSSSVSTTSIYYNLYVYYKHIRVFVLCGQFSFSKTCRRTMKATGCEVLFYVILCFIPEVDTLSK